MRCFFFICLKIVRFSCVLCSNGTRVNQKKKTWLENLPYNSHKELILFGNSERYFGYYLISYKKKSIYISIVKTILMLTTLNLIIIIFKNTQLS